jgi:DNA repair protein RecO (recombination protein O)
MIETIRGVILAETAVGDYDKFMTVLTERGTMSVFGNGIKRLKSPNFVGTQLYSYSEFTVAQKGDKYYLREASLIESFFAMRNTIEGIALASYISQVAVDLSVEGDGARELLRLVLNCFYIISEGKKPIGQVKAVFELRALADAGYAPDIVGCNGCGKYNLNVYYFDVEGGNFLCEDCFRRRNADFEDALRRENESEGIYSGTRLIMILSPDVYVAMRYILYSRPERIFAFELKDGALDELCDVCEKYVTCHMEKNYRTLDFYNSVVKKKD